MVCLFVCLFWSRSYWTWNCTRNSSKLSVIGRLYLVTLSIYWRKTLVYYFTELFFNLILKNSVNENMHRPHGIATKTNKCFLSLYVKLLDKHYQGCFCSQYFCPLQKKTISSVPEICKNTTYCSVWVSESHLAESLSYRMFLWKWPCKNVFGLEPKLGCDCNTYSRANANHVLDWCNVTWTGVGVMSKE